MAYWAKIVNDKSWNGLTQSWSGAKKVIEVIVCDEADLANITSDIPGTWIETWLDANGSADKRYNFASIGHLWDVAGDFFYKPSEYPSWTLNNKKIMTPPVAQGTDGDSPFLWNETDQAWE
jgi:hypothetical protein